MTTKVKKLRIRIRTAEVKILTVFFFWTNMAMTSYGSEEGGINNSKLATGTKQLVQDATTYLMIMAPIVAGLLIIYFCIRRSMADEMDQKKWNNRIAVAVISCIGAVLGSATLNVIIGYYQ